MLRGHGLLLLDPFDCLDCLRGLTESAFESGALQNQGVPNRSRILNNYAAFGCAFLRMTPVKGVGLLLVCFQTRRKEGRQFNDIV